MEKSEHITKLAGALVGFQADMENVSKDATNPFYKSGYATLENTISTAKPHLKAHGLAFSQLPSGENELTTILMHESGEYISATARMTPKDATPQGQGSAITYLRRYALSAVLGIATEDDDDGNEASKLNKAPVASKTAPSATKPADPTLRQKQRIVELLKELGREVDKDTVGTVVLKLTKLELIEEAYPQIIDRLTVLADEAHNK